MEKREMCVCWIGCSGPWGLYVVWPLALPAAGQPRCPMLWAEGCTLSAFQQETIRQLCTCLYIR